MRHGTIAPSFAVWPGRAISGLAVAIGLSLTGCAPSRISQCRAIIEIARTTADETREAGSGKPEAMRQAADRFDRAAKDLNGQWITDKQLQTLRTDFASVYGNASRAAREFLNATQQKDRALAEVAVQSLEQAANQEKTAIAATNRYCQVNPSPP